MIKAKTFFFALLFLSSVATAAPQYLAIEGQLFEDAAGQVPVESNNVTIVLEVLSPAPSSCVLYEESHILNMTGANGYFSLQLGAGTQGGSDYEDTNTMANAFNNALATVTPTTCAVGPNYTPAGDDGRALRITYDSGSGPQTLSQNIQLTSTPFALSAGSINGLNAADILTVNTIGGNVLTQANLEWTFASSARFAELQALVDGTSTQYLSGTPATDFSVNSNKITDVATPTLANDATNKAYVDQNIGGMAADNTTLSALGAGDSGEVLQWNGTQWTSAPPVGDSTKLPLAGGTMTGALNMGSNSISNIQNVTAAGTVDSNNAYVRGNFAVFNGANYVGFNAPAAASNILWTLPSADGTGGQALITDGSGALSWANAGESNTASNIGTAGVAVFEQKNVLNLEFRSINDDGSGKISVSHDSVNNEVDLGVNEGALSSSLIPITPVGDVIASNIQAAIAELDSEKLSSDGTTPLSANWDLGGTYTITNVPGPSAGTDVANRNYVDTSLASLTISDVEDADANTRIQVEEGANDDTIRFDTSGVERMVLNPMGYLGIGAENPTSVVDIRRNGQTEIKLQNASNTVNEGPALTAIRGRNTLGSPTTVNFGDSLFKISAGGHDSTAWYPNSAAIRFVASENWGSSNHGSKISFFASPTGGGPIQEMMTLTDGFLGLGTNTPAHMLHVAGDARIDGPLQINELHFTSPVTEGSSCGGGQNGNLTNSTSNELLQCDGTSWQRVAGEDGVDPAFDVGAGDTIDFAQTLVASTPNDCGTFNFHNMEDGAEYKFLVNGTNSATCTLNFFAGAGVGTLSPRYTAGGHTATTASFSRLYKFLVVGSQVIVTFEAIQP